MYSIVKTVITLLILANPLIYKTEDIMGWENFNDFYGLEFPDTSHDFGYEKLHDFNIAVHHFKPESSRGTVLVVHGYYDHVGILRNLISSLLDNDYSVIAFDLPGHGLSCGARADIDDFNEYTLILNELYEQAQKEFDSPLHLIGHSTGGAIIIDSLLKHELHNVSKIVLVSPLIHSNHWVKSTIGNRIADIFTDEVPRIFRKNSSDEFYLEFIMRSDPLHYRKVPLNWFQSLSRWNDEIDHYEKSTVDVLVLQGNRDITVDWKYNMEFIRNKFTESRIEIIEDGNHQLFNESEVIKEKVFIEIIAYLESF